MKRLQNATMIGWLVLCLVYTAGDVVALAAMDALSGHGNIWSVSVTLKFGALAINVMALTLMLAIFIKAWFDSRRGTWRHSEVKSMIFLYLICPGTSVKYLADLLASGLVSAPCGASDAAAALRGTAILVNLIALALTLVILARSWSGCRQGGSHHGHWDQAQMKAIDSAAGHALWFAWLLTLEATHGHIGAWREWAETLRVAALGLYMAYFACSLFKLADRAKFMIPADRRTGRMHYRLQGLAR